MLQKLDKWLSTCLARTDLLIALLRISLGIVFFWFGALKVAGYNPVYDLVAGVSPLLAEGWGNLLLGGFETIIGLLLLANVFPTAVHIALVFHLTGTFLTFITAPELMFDPRFPLLTMAGEFVIKNLTLAASGIVVLAYERNRRNKILTSK